MGIKETFRTLIAPATLSPPQAKFIGEGPVFANVGVQRLPAVPDAGDRSLVDAYRTNQLVRSCVDILSASATDPDLVVQRKDSDEEWRTITGHPFRQLLIRPNPDMDFAAFFSFAQASIEVVGVFYAELVYSKAGLVVEMWPLQPTDVTPVYKTDAENRKVLEYYHYHNGMFEKDILPEFMLVRDDIALGGRLSPLASAIRNVDSDNAHTDYVRGFFNNAGVPSGILKIKGREIDQAESDRLRSQWRARYGRQYGNQHDLAVLDEFADYQQIGSKLDDLESEFTRGFDESRLCMAFGVPPIIVYTQSGLARATYNNMGDAWEWFWNQTMSTKLKQWRSFFTVSLLELYEKRDDVVMEKSRLYWDMADVAALQENISDAVERETKMFTVGGTSLDEFRASVGRRSYHDAELGQMNYFRLSAMVWQDDIPEEEPVNTTEDDEAPEEEEPEEEETKRQIKMARKAKENELRMVDDYATRLYQFADNARKGLLSKDELIAAIANESRESLTAAFLLGALMEDGELTDAEFNALDLHIEQAAGSASALSEDIFNGRYGGAFGEGETFASLTKRIAKWSAAALGVVVLGRTYRKDDPLLTWKRGRTKRPCGDCIDNEGLTMSASAWRRFWPASKLPRGNDLECGGYECHCDLVEA